MNHFVNLLIQEMNGIVHMAMPILIIAYVIPSAIANPYSSLIIAMIIAAWRVFLIYQQAKNEAVILKFEPTGEIRAELEELVRSCGMNPAAINLRYRFVNDMVAVTTFNLIGIDHMVWYGLENDPQAMEAQEIIQRIMAFSLTPEQIENLTKIKQFLSPAAQRFIFRHELGHVYYQYTYKKLISVGLIITLFAYAGIRLGYSLYPTLGVFAILVAIVAAGVLDIALSYVSNYFFKTWAEKYADEFAARYSNAEEILAAADFFERYQEIIDTARKPWGIVAKLPNSLLAGYPETPVRVAYLRGIAATK